MVLLHKAFGLALAAVFLAIFFWGLVSWIRNRDPGVWFWRLLAVGQAGLAVPALTGIVLFALGGRRGWLHYAYGAFPILVLVFAHRNAGRWFKGIEWAMFALAGLVNFGLMLRAFTTGF